MAVSTAIWSGVIRTGPWPIETEMVSPGYQGILRALRLQAMSGTSPCFSPWISIPVGVPMPNSREYLAMRSIPRRWPTP